MSEPTKVKRPRQAETVAANGSTTDGTSHAAVVHPPIPISEALRSSGSREAPATSGRVSSP
jgi:hypothetical protein